MREIEHHWLGQADAELQIYLLLFQKNYGGRFSAEKVEQIIHNILCDLLLTTLQVSSILINIKPTLYFNTSYCGKSHWNGVKSSRLTKF